MKVKKNDIVRVEYTGTLKDGKVFDSSEGKVPLVFKAGAQQVIAGFDKAIQGMEKGEEKTVTILAKDAYGPRNEELVKEFPREGLPPEIKPEPGQMLAVKGPHGQAMPAKIVGITNTTLTLDLNPPLAGQDLTFKLKVVGLNEEGDKNPAVVSDCSDSACHSCSNC